MSAILVKTGKYRDRDEDKLTQQPLLVADNFARAVDFILEKLIYQ